ncbi:FecR family protein [Saccharospirillum mangrovi]|uniref:FecR family protein n=1 Tax=Saccharospirillum mangrovi TaxID=2161747 RepID=UPI00130073B8|nr:FecR family protein [Saccharospirillum mangrovi]
MILSLPLWASVGKVVIASGNVYALDTNNEYRVLYRRAEIFAGDTLITEANSQLQLRFTDNAVLALREQSRLRIDAYHGSSDTQQEQVLMNLLEGGLRTISGSLGKSNREAYRLDTPNASIGIRGTQYEAVLTNDRLAVGVYEGGIVVSNAQGSLALGLGGNFNFAEVSPGQAPLGTLIAPAVLNGAQTPDRQSQSGAQSESSGSTFLADANLATGPDSDPDNLIEIPTTDKQPSFNTVENSLPDSPGASSSLLSAEQQAALNQDGQFGFLLTPDASPLNYVYGAQLNGSTFYAQYNDGADPETGLPTAVIHSPAGMSATPLASHDLGNGYHVDWGIWDVDAANPAQGHSADGIATIDTPFFYVEADPVATAGLSGTRQFTLSDVDNNFSASLPLDLAVGNPQVSMTVNFDSLNVNGSIGFYAESPDGDSAHDTWFMRFAGQADGAFVEANLWGSSVTDGSTNNAYGLTGAMGGMFTGSNGQDFVGGFNAEVVNGPGDNSVADSASGVFLLEPTSN